MEKKRGAGNETQTGKRRHGAGYVSLWDGNFREVKGL